MELDRAPAVTPQHGAGALGQHLDRKHRVGRRDKWSGEQRVGTQRNQQERLDLGPDHRTASGERVRGRPGGSREHDSVAAPPRQRSTVNLDHELEHALARRLLDSRLVEGPARDGTAVSGDHHVDRHPLLDVVPPVHDALDGGGEILTLRLRKKADPAEVHAEHRRPLAAGQLRPAQQRPVAAKHDHQLAPSAGVRTGGDQLHPGQVELLALVFDGADRQPGGVQAIHHEMGASFRGRPAGVRDEEDATGYWSHSDPRSSMCRAP